MSQKYLSTGEKLKVTQAWTDLAVKGYLHITGYGKQIAIEHYIS